MKAATREQDAALIARLLADDPAAWRELLATYQPYLTARAFKITHCREDAEEVVLEGIMRLRRNLPNFRRECSLLTFLDSIVCRCALNRYHYWRRRRRDAGLPIDVKVADGGTLADRLPSVDLPTAEAVEFAELNQNVAAALERIEPHFQSILRRLFAGSDYKEIARHEGIEMGTVKSRIARAREALRRQLFTLTRERRKVA